jgi:hypothetical protein
MSENFEGYFPSAGWEVFDDDGSTNGEYYWDDDDYKPHQGSWSAWCANGGANGLDPQYNNYPNNCKSWMIYGPFSLSDAVDAELLFYYWLDSESGYDYFYWVASINGTNFYGYSISGNSGGWWYENFDLTNVPTLGNLTGKSSVWIAFYFGSDLSNTYKGAFVDDVVLQKNLPSKPDLVVTDVAVSNSSPGLAKYDYLYTSVYIKNNGSAEAGGFWTDIFYNQVTPSPPTTGDDYRRTDSLTAGSSDNFTFVTRDTFWTSHSWNMYLLTDSYAEVAEQNENNNTYGPVTINWSTRTTSPVRTRDEITETAMSFVTPEWQPSTANISPPDDCSGWSIDPPAIIQDFRFLVWLTSGVAGIDRMIFYPF